MYKQAGRKALKIYIYYQLGANCSPEKKFKLKTENLTSREQQLLLGFQLGLLRRLAFILFLLDNAIDPLRVFGHVCINGRLSGHSALREPVADHAIGHPARLLAIEVHQRSAGVPGTRVLRELSASTELLWAKSNAVGLQDFGAVLIRDVGNSQFQLNRTVDVDEVLVD